MTASLSVFFIFPALFLVFGLLPVFPFGYSGVRGNPCHSLLRPLSLDLLLPLSTPSPSGSGLRNGLDT